VVLSDDDRLGGVELSEERQRCERLEAALMETMTRRLVLAYQQVASQPLLALARWQVQQKPLLGWHQQASQRSFAE
jgi:hypothetical protein